ncbi:MAG: cation transporter [Tannerella sp.]|jgi:Cu(I)/Ag(I) efflux system membrane fusion protein|nr:cation transporter [Tannerella sp.]
MKRIIHLLTAIAMTIAVSACSNSASNKNSASNEKTESNAAETKSEVLHAMLTVNGSCGMCKTRIEKTAKSIEGVSTAEWNLEKQQLHLHFDANKTSLKAISEAIAKVGHDTESDKADDDVYNALPACCKYRK